MLSHCVSVSGALALGLGGDVILARDEPGRKRTAWRTVEGTPLRGKTCDTTNKCVSCG